MNTLTQKSAQSSEVDVLAAARGDGEAFCRLVSRYSNTVTAITLSIMGNRQESEDIAQEVFIKAWRRLGTLNNPASFGPWIRQMARNQALSAKRKRRPTPVNQDLLEAAVHPGPSPRDGIEAAQSSAFLQEALETLSDGTREVVILYYREGQQIKQVATLLDLSEDAVKKRLSRARAQLKDALLAKMAPALKASAPGSAFVVGIATAIGAPGVAAASSGAALGQGALKSGLLKGASAGALGGAALGGILGGLGVHLGIKAEADYIDATPELRGQLRAIGMQGIALVAVLSIAFVALAFARVHPAWAILPMLALSLGLFWLFMVKAPRLSDAHLKERAKSDPDGIRKLKAVQKRRWFGFILGQVSGWGALIWVILL